jgi:hypothetical protein
LFRRSRDRAIRTRQQFENLFVPFRSLAIEKHAVDRKLKVAFWEVVVSPNEFVHQRPIAGSQTFEHTAEPCVICEAFKKKDAGRVHQSTIAVNPTGSMGSKITTESKVLPRDFESYESALSRDFPEPPFPPGESNG